MGEANQRGSFLERRRKAIDLDRELKSLRKLRDVLACVVFEQGRIRIPATARGKLGDYALRLAPQENGDLVVTFERPEAG